MAGELDDMGREAAAMTRAMLEIAGLVAMRARERGQKEAEARARVLSARQKQVKDAKLRELRAVKAMDPRNAQLAKMITQNTATIKAPGQTLAKTEAEKLALGKTVGAAKTLGLDKTTEKSLGLEKAATLAAAPEKAAGKTMSKTVGESAAKAISHDSPERRAALKAGLEKAGLGKEVVKGRMLADIGQARPVAEAMKVAPKLALAAVPLPQAHVARKALDLGLGRGLYR
ncbi:hypothetical protein [Skermania piniformis]|uniref:Uncharacterized protein n=1 Tax=Skermania pinensis TaxID=39122 RepID=A0ABX8SC33_9ACTN|nr:hypothetical protein [Skermania piniformis]QXQ15429.1 hypothetical protein KV203_09060 [Skermania piniformis]